MEERKMVQKDKKEKTENQKLTYEQLNEACAQLYQQNQVLSKQLQQQNMALMFKRLDYLFMVLKYNEVIDDREFIEACVDEIKEALTTDKAEGNSEGN